MKQQSLSSKTGEVRFRKKLVNQHKGLTTFYPTHTNAQQNLKLLRERAQRTFQIFSDLKNQKIALSPFLEIGGEKCERAAVISSKMKGVGAVVDISAESLESAKFFCIKIGLKKLPIRICADCYHLPFLDNSFAFAFTFQTLHHFPDPMPVVDEVYRVISPGGYFFIDEEPVKQLLNIPLFRRDFNLRWWEKILKAALILPFISKIGKSEVDEEVLEESFASNVWERALNSFEEVSANLIPFPYGPRTHIQKNSRAHWLNAKLLTLLFLSIGGGGIQALCKKKGILTDKKFDIYQSIVCPTCQIRLNNHNNEFFCKKCKTVFPVKNGVHYLLPEELLSKLYPNIL